MTKRFSASVAAPLMLAGAALTALGAAAASDRITLAQTRDASRSAAATPLTLLPCDIEYRQTRIRFWDAYAGRWETKAVDRPYRVCD